MVQSNSLGEFQLIERFFARPRTNRADVALGVGDDGALLSVPAGMHLAVTMDTLVEGRHFLAGTDPRALGHKALAVNLSDLAAMGAEPAWAVLSLCVPSVEEGWLASFAEGFFALADLHGVQLVGGDTVRGPLALTLTLHGFVPKGEALRRDGAQPGDAVCVTGYLGDGAGGLRIALGQAHAAARDEDYLRGRLDCPTPRLAEGRALRGVASAAIDISDGFAADLGHILARSGVGASIDVDALPLSEPLLRTVGLLDAQRLALTGGDDYEICFTAPEAALEQLPFSFTRIGTIESAPGLRLHTRNGTEVRIEKSGYDHFGAA